MTVTVFPSLILVSDIIMDEYVAEKYIFYTRKQSVRMFKKKYKSQYRLERICNKIKK